MKGQFTTAVTTCSTVRTFRGFPAASFPGHSHLQSLQYANMETAWDVWSHTVISGRQRVDTWVTVPDHNNSCVATHCLWHHDKHY